MAKVVATGWKVKQGKPDRVSSCGTWKDHWLVFSGVTWPPYCSVYGCLQTPTLGAIVYNLAVAGEHIAPLCHACHNLVVRFKLNNEVILVSAEQAQTREAIKT